MKQEEQKRLITQTLDAMVGHTYLYGNGVHKILDFRFNDERERVYIKTDKKEFDRDYESVLVFINQLQPSQANGISKYENREEIIPVAQINSSVISECKNVLLDSIKKLQSDPKYVDQASAIIENVNTIIELGKIEVQQLDLLYKLKRKGEL